MNDKVRHPKNRLRPMERAVKPSIDDGMGEVVGMKRTVLWVWRECHNDLQSHPRPSGRAGCDDDPCGTFSRSRCRSVPAVFSVVGTVLRLRICGTFSRSRFRSVPEDLWYFFP